MQRLMQTNRRMGERTFLSNQMVQDDSKGWLPLGSAGAGAEAAESDMTTKNIKERQFEDVHAMLDRNLDLFAGSAGIPIKLLRTTCSTLGERDRPPL